MSTVLGIDLGTTFSAVATLDETGRPKILHNSDGANITASVVSFITGGAAVIGEEARRALGVDPHTFGRFKREMGTPARYEVGGRTFSPTELSAMLLRKLRQDAEKIAGPSDSAVVTIPANFANEAREATMEAARLAGLDVKFIINEPTAAALYYAFKSGAALSGHYAVYDLGGGTFDVSIIHVSGHDVEVVATDGVSRLGGDDFDRALQALVQRKYEQKTGHRLDASDFTASDAEQEKKSLAKRDRVQCRVSGPGGREIIEITNAEFHEAISTLIVQAEMLCESVVEEAGLALSDVREVFLVGGSTRVPAVRESVERVFRRPPTDTVNVDEVVALGAALYAAYKSDRADLSAIQRASIAKIRVSEITGKYFGTLAVIDDPARKAQALENTSLIKKGTKIPCSVTETFYTMRDDQPTVECSVTESSADERDPRFVKIIWRGQLDVPRGRPRGQAIRITYAYDENQIMSCSFVDVATGRERTVDLNVSGASAASKADLDKFMVE
jgi:molecular chaperone DnaK